jgi:hypothetical protein
MSRPLDTTPKAGQKPVDEFMGEQAVNPTLAPQAVYQPQFQGIGAGELIDPNVGAVTGDLTQQTAVAPTATAQGVTGQAALATPTIIGQAPTVDAATGTARREEAAQGTTTTADAQTGVSTQIQPIKSREVGAKEIAEAATADRTFMEDMTAAQSGFVSDAQAATMTVSPEMTVQGQLAEISKQFEGGKVPAFAAGIVRKANAIMAQRGMAASSMAGAAITQAVMEASLPIATRDAQTYYSTAMKIMSNEQQANLFNSQQNMKVDLANVSNRQQMTLARAQVEASLANQELKNQQQVNILNATRFAEAANMTFSQEQNRVFANSKMMETMNLQNLSNEQTTALANAATLAQMDMANLNARQQMAVNNANNFFSMDMANLTNEQQSRIINQQQQQQILLSDQASLNAAEQFNATSQNQTTQFFAGLGADISKFNATATNASNQFNAGQVNAMAQFNANVQNARDQFNANNKQVIAQSNAKWRRDINTANTAAQNAANQVNAANYYNLSNTALNNIWQQFRDEADYAYTASENAADRAFNYAMAILESQVTQDLFDQKIAHANASAIGGFLADLGVSYIASR